MNIVFFEIEDWEIAFLKEKLSGHTIQFFPEHTTDQDIEKLKDTEVLSVFIYSQLTKEFLAQLPNLKLIATRSTGFDHIDLAYCKERGIKICNVPEYGTYTVAEHTFALLLALSRNLIASVERTRKGDFSLHNLMGFDLHKKTIGVVGVGNIGTSVIKIAKGFGMDVIGYARTPKMELAQSLGFTYVDLDHLLSVSDIITLHVPYTKETHHMINKDNIQKLKKGSILINTARGGLVETEAMLMGLDEKILRGVGIDVLEEECMIKEERQLLTGKFLKECDLKTQLLNHVLLIRENVIVTPHNAFNSAEALNTILETTVKNVIQFAGNSPQNII